MISICEYCNQSNPPLIVLTCGYTVCLSHVDNESSNFNCFICKSHQISKKQLFEMNKNKFVLEHQELNNKINRLIRFIFKYKSIKQDSSFYIKEYFDSIRDQINLKKTQIKNDIIQQIDQYSDKLFNQIDKFKPVYEKNLQKSLSLVDLEEIDVKLKNELENETKKLNYIEKISFIISEMNKVIEKQIYFHSSNDIINIDLEKYFGLLNIDFYLKPQTPNFLKMKEKNHFESNATCIEVSESDKIIAGTKCGLIKIWDLTNGKCIKKIKAHKKMVNCVKIGENDKLFSCSADGTIKIWNKINGECIKTISSPKSCIEVIELYEDKIFSCDWSELIRVWEIESGKCVQILNKHESFVNCFKLFEIKKAISGSNDKTLILWDLNDYVSLRTFMGHKDAILCIEKLDEVFFISGSRDGEIRIWNINNGECLINLIEHEKPVRDLQICGNDEILSCSEDGSIKLWSCFSDKSLSTFKCDNSELICLKILSNNIATCDKNGIIKVLD